MSYSKEQVVEEVFERVSSKVLNNLRNKISFPKEVVWVIGPSKSGKTCISSFIAEKRKHGRDPTTQLTFKGQDFDLWLEQTLLQIVDMESRNGVVVDDFFAYPDECVIALPLIHQFLIKIRARKQRRNRKLPITRYRLIFLNTSLEALAKRDIASGGEHDLGKMERETKLYKNIEKNLASDYKFNVIETNSDDINQTKQQVLTELDHPNNGWPNKYNSQQLANLYKASGQQSYLPRSQSWGNPNPRGQNQQYWGRMNSNRSDFSDSAGLSPYGSQNHYYANNMTPGHHSYHPSGGSRFTFPEQNGASAEFFPQGNSSDPNNVPARLIIPTNGNKDQESPSEINPNTPNGNVYRPSTPMSYSSHYPPHNQAAQNNNHRNQIRPQSCRRDNRGNWNNFNNTGQNNRNYYPSNQQRHPQRPHTTRPVYNATSTARGDVPTSCRLSQMAENDRHSFFPTSTRSSYKTVPHQTPFSPGGGMQNEMSQTPVSMRRVSIKSTNSSKIRDEFLQICARLEAKFGKENLIYPREIIWMIGPPGAGKSTLARSLSEQRKYNSTPIVLREICQAVIAQNNGKLKIEQVVEQLMIKLFDPQFKDGVVVDGFVSTTSARVVPFMFKYFHEIFELSKNPHPPIFKFCVLYVNEDNSVRRQIVNYEQQQKEQKGEKATKSFDAEEGRKLYRKFLKRTQQVVELIEMHFSFHLIDANGTLPQVEMIASAEIASERNGALNHDATLVKALSPATNSNRRRNNHSWKGGYSQRSQGHNNSYRNKTPYRSNSYRATTPSSNNLQSPRTPEFRLAPKNHSAQFCHGLNVDLMQYLSQVNDRELLGALRRSVLEIINGPNYDSRQVQNKIPTAQTVSLDSKNSLNISKDYVAQPLIKATRAMMYWDAAGHCYLVDRRFQFFSLHSKFYQAAHVGEGLLDGVLVVDTEGKIVFLAQDAATHQSKRLKDCWFSQRTHECRTAVEDLNASSDGSEPIHIEFLDPMPTKEIETLLSIISLNESDERLLTLNGGRQIPVHGLSFIPDKTGFHGAHGARIYTWNFLEGAARDFKVKAPYDEEQVFLYLSGPKNADSCFQRGKFSEEVQEKFQTIVDEALSSGAVKFFIVSCQYSQSARLWIPHSFRPNKTRATPINVVAESISSWENRMSLSEVLSFLNGSDVRVIGTEQISI